MEKSSVSQSKRARSSKAIGPAMLMVRPHVGGAPPGACPTSRERSGESNRCATETRLVREVGRLRKPWWRKAGAAAMVRLLLIVALLGVRIGDAIHPGANMRTTFRTWESENADNGMPRMTCRGRWTRDDWAAVATGRQPGGGVAAFLEADSSDDDSSIAPSVAASSDDEAGPTIDDAEASRCGAKRMRPGLDESDIEDDSFEQEEWDNRPSQDDNVASAMPSSEGVGLVEFIRAAKFQGSKLGMVFKRGLWGQGYYADSGVRVIEVAPELLPALQVRPVILSLDILVPGAPGPPGSMLAVGAEEVHGLVSRLDAPTTGPGGVRGAGHVLG